MFGRSLLIKRTFLSISLVQGDRETFEMSAAEGHTLENGAYSWLGPGDPSSSLAVDVLHAARLKAAGAPAAVALDLASRALGISLERLHEIVRWHEEYLRWHDGQPD